MRRPAERGRVPYPKANSSTSHPEKFRSEALRARALSTKSVDKSVDGRRHAPFTRLKYD